jgi:hypothetical protein
VDVEVSCLLLFVVETSQLRDDVQRTNMRLTQLVVERADGAQAIETFKRSVGYQWELVRARL